MHKLILPAILAAALLAGCGDSSEPETASKPAATEEPAATPEPTSTPEFDPSLVKLAKQTTKGTSYARDMSLVNGAVENGDGIDVHTDLYYDDEGKLFAERVATIFYNLGYTPVRVYAGNGELLLKKEPS